MRSDRRCPELAALAVLVVATAVSVCGCATRTSAIAASTYGKASLYGSATAYVRLAPDEAFKPAVGILLEREDVKITDLDEARTRCTAMAGERKVTLRVIESTPGRSRLSLMVGGGHEPGANAELADELVKRICSRLAPGCE